MREYNFDGLAGQTHSYAGLSLGNLASTRYAGQRGSPRAAVLQGLAKMRFVAQLGVGQAVLPPPFRPDIATLRRLGFGGSDVQVLERVAQREPALLQAVSSASAMWAANAATVAPSSDTADGRVHFTPANLVTMFHRSLEVPFTTRVLGRIFADETRFVVHDPLPAVGWFSDEGAANHTRLVSGAQRVHLFAWGRSASGETTRQPSRFPARQTLEACRALARLHELGSEQALLVQQSPEGIDAGAFHTDVLAVGHGAFLMLHEDAFVDHERVLDALRARLGDSFVACVARREELPVAAAVAAYPFNSQLLEVAPGRLVIVAPREAEQTVEARRYLERVVAEPNPVSAVHFLDVNASMNNGGGPACLRLRVPLEEHERAAVGPRVFLDEALYLELEAWAQRHYRDRLELADLADPALLDEVRTALDELTGILQLGSLYDFQRA